MQKNEKRIWPGRNKTASFWWHKKSFCPLTVNISIGQGNGKKRKRDMLREGENIKKKKRSQEKRQKKSEKQKTKKIMSCHCRHRKNVISHNNEPRFWATELRGVAEREVGSGEVHEGGERDRGGGSGLVGCLACLNVAGANGAQLMTGEPSLEPSRADSI